MVTVPALTPVSNPVFASMVAKASEEDQVPPASPLEVSCNVDPEQTVLPPDIVPAFRSDVIVATTAVLEAVVQLPEVAST